MAYECGYEGGYDDIICASSLVGILCGGGYGGFPYAMGTYGGAVPCSGLLPSPSSEILSNVEELCIPASSCYYR